MIVSVKIVYLNPAGQIGGAERVLLDIMASLKASDPDYRPYLLTGAAGPLVERAAAVGVPVTVLPFPPELARLGDGGAGGPAGSQIGRLSLLMRLIKAGGNVAVYFRRLRRALKQLGPDIIHTNGFKMHLLGLLARPNRIPVVCHIHDYLSARPFMSRILPRLTPRCAALIAVSNSVAADVRTVCGDQVPVRTIYNAVDLDHYSPVGPRLDLDRLSGLPPAPMETVRVGLFATMARWKGHEVFLKAISQLPDELAVRAYVIGGALYQTDGSQCSIPELRNLAAQLGLSHKVGFTGFIDESAAAMRACDIIVHASTRPEPFGLVIVEGMACERAVVVSNAGGASELITHGVDALGHPPGDVKALARHLETLVMNESLRLKLAQCGYVNATRRFERTVMGGEMLSLYRDVAALNQVI
ncbi:MAG TPA: glycosyltransferase [Blastocatellia bacterium]|nr:glycosyltransferase [Blastocatellia bacterium]